MVSTVGPPPYATGYTTLNVTSSQYWGCEEAERKYKRENLVHVEPYPVEEGHWWVKIGNEKPEVAFIKDGYASFLGGDSGIGLFGMQHKDYLVKLLKKVEEYKDEA